MRFSGVSDASSPPTAGQFSWTRSANSHKRRRLLYYVYSKNENSSGSGAANRLPLTCE